MGVYLASARFTQQNLLRESAGGIASIFIGDGHSTRGRDWVGSHTGACHRAPFEWHMALPAPALGDLAGGVVFGISRE